MKNQCAKGKSIQYIIQLDFNKKTTKLNIELNNNIKELILPDQRQAFDIENEQHRVWRAIPVYKELRRRVILVHVATYEIGRHHRHGAYPQ